MDHKDILQKIQNNLELKNITWKESGIPTLTNSTSNSKRATKASLSFSDDEFILDLDSDPLNENGHKLDCTCKHCMLKPRSKDVTALSSIKAEPCINPLNKKRS